MFKTLPIYDPIVYYSHLYLRGHKYLEVALKGIFERRVNNTNKNEVNTIKLEDMPEFQRSIFSRNVMQICALAAALFMYVVELYLRRGTYIMILFGHIFGNLFGMVLSEYLANYIQSRIFVLPIPRIKTERLLLRPFCIDDAKEYFSLFTNPEVLKGTGNPHTVEETAVQEWIVKQSKQWQEGKRLSMLITKRQTKEIIGSVALHSISDQYTSAELGYWIARGEWGKGYATEASAAMVSFAFEKMQLDYVVAMHFVTNSKSGRVLMKLGFQYEQLLKDAHLNQDGTYEDYKLYSLFQAEYNAHLKKMN